MDTPRASSGTIVVGIDGSPAADLALDWAADQAALEHRPLALVHASGPLHPVWLGAPPVDFDDLRANVSAQARVVMDAAVSRALAAHPDLDVRQVLSETDPREALLDISEGAAMVVLGSRGRGPVRSLLLGSVSAAVSKHADCPVVVLRPEDPDFPHEYPHHGVLVGIQGTAVAQPTLELAYRLASSRRLSLIVLQCFWDARFDADDFAAPDLETVSEDEIGHEEGRSQLTRVLAEMSEKFPDVDVAVRLQHGFLEQHLIQLSPSMDAVVLGSHHPNLLQRAAYGSLATSVLEHAHGAVVVVPLPASSDATNSPTTS